MTDYREKASKLADQILMDQPAEIDIGKLTQALHDAHLAGRREGIEEAAKRLDRADGDKEPLEPSALAKAIRALLRGGK